MPGRRGPSALQLIHEGLGDEAVAALTGLPIADVAIVREAHAEVMALRASSFDSSNEVGR